MLFEYFKKHWLKIGLWLLVILPLLTTIIANILLLIYMYWPQSYDEINFQNFRAKQSHAIIAAHGIDDTPSTWIEPLFSLYQQQQLEGALLPVNWSHYARDPLRCAIDGGRIGEKIGQQIAAARQLKTVQLIAHSCGAFVIYKACRAIKAAQPNVVIQTTYLDPVTIYGPLFHYGIDHFGDCADYSESYIDTGDNIYGSNEPLPHTHTYDVTAIRQHHAVDINPHLWPTQYYRNLVSNDTALTLFNTDNLPVRKPAGKLEKVTPNQ